MSILRRCSCWVFGCLILVVLAPAAGVFGQSQLGNVQKTWSMSGGDNPVAGDALTYTVTIPNVGNAPLNDVVFSDFPDPLTALVSGSVTTTHGTVVVGNNPGDSNIVVNVGTIAPGDAAVITFEAATCQCIQYPVTVSNQGFVNTDNGNSPTDNPGTGTPGDSTDTPVNPQGMPELGTPAKSCALHADVDGGGQLSPGDTLRYTVVIPNNGNVPVVNATFSDALDPNTSLVVGSVSTSQGTVQTGNNAGDRTVVVSLDTLSVGDSVTITFEVVINNNVTQVSNQGFVDYAGDTIGTDDPGTAAANDPTVCQVFPAQQPEVESLKAVSLSNDLDGTGVTSPGDTLTYTITINNNGGAPADNISFADTPDAQTRLVSGTVTTTVGEVVTGNAPNHTSIQVNVGTLAPGQSAVIRFNVTVNPGATGTISNQGTVNTPSGPTPTDNPGTSTPGDSTDTPVGPQEAPELTSPTKVVSLAVDADGSGTISQGDTLRYTVTIPNAGAALAPNLVFTDTPDASTTLIPGTVITSQGTVATGNNPGDSTVRVNLGDLPGNRTATISFDVRISGGAANICNQGSLQTSDGPLPTNNPDTRAAQDPTCTPVNPQQPPLMPLKEFSVAQDADGSGGASPGDTLRYTVRIPNNSISTVAGVVFNDLVDPNTTLLPGRVNTSQGTVQQGNNPGDDTVIVNVGDIASGQTVTISFDVMVNAGAQRVVNQAFVDAPSIERQPTDNPNTPERDDPTVTNIVPAPVARCEFELVTRLSSTVLVVRFDDSSIADGTNIVDWMWDFGDGGTCNRQNLEGCSARFGSTVNRGTLQSPVHLFDGLGRFVIKLKVTDQSGKSSTSVCAFSFGDPTVFEVLDQNANHFVDDSEIITAVNYWILGVPVPNTNGKLITDKMIMTLMDKWIKGEAM